MDTEHPPWHTLSGIQAAQALQTLSAEGLTTYVVNERLATYGENKLDEAAPRPLWLKFVDQFKNFLVIVLLLAAGLAWAIGDLKDAAVILIVVILNACLGFWQEHRAERTLAALKDMLAAHARVRRNGVVSEVDASQLVPGDIVLLEAGDRVPADGRLLGHEHEEPDQDTHHDEDDRQALVVGELVAVEHLVDDRRSCLEAIRLREDASIRAHVTDALA